MTLQPNEHAHLPPAPATRAPGSTSPADAARPTPPSDPRTLSCIDALELALLYPGWKPYGRPSDPTRRS